VAADAISLSIPHSAPFHGVARLVVGGLAARLDLSYEDLEDLQLALVSVLERDGYAAGPVVTVRLLVEEDRVGVAIGPLDARELSADLERQSEEGVSMRRLLETLVHEISLEEREGGHWLRLVKRVAVAQGSRAGEEA
jgi:anti-sigma regulatory factor (Ser/Thr protein kinase)